MAKPRTPQPEGALYVRLPVKAVAKLDRAADALGMHKKDLIAGLVNRYVDPDTRQGLDALGTLSTPPRRVIIDSSAAPTLGQYSFQSYDPPEVMTVEQAAQLLQLEVAAVLELAEAGELPGKKLGNQWRFSRAAVIAWLA